MPGYFFRRGLLLFPVTIQGEIKALLVFKNQVVWDYSHSVTEISSALFASFCFLWKNAQHERVIVLMDFFINIACGGLRWTLPANTACLRTWRPVWVLIHCALFPCYFFVNVCLGQGWSPTPPRYLWCFFKRTVSAGREFQPSLPQQWNAYTHCQIWNWDSDTRRSFYLLCTPPLHA